MICVGPLEEEVSPKALDSNNVKLILTDDKLRLGTIVEWGNSDDENSARIVDIKKKMTKNQRNSNNSPEFSDLYNGRSNGSSLTPSGFTISLFKLSTTLSPTKLSSRQITVGKDSS